MKRDEIEPLLHQFFPEDRKLLSTQTLVGSTRHVVQSWKLSESPHTLIAKISTADNAPLLHVEFERLQWYAKQQILPIPKPIGFVHNHLNTRKSVLLMEYVPGKTLTHAQLSMHGRIAVETQLANYLIALHSHKNKHYGCPISGDAYSNHPQRLAQKLHNVFSRNADMLGKLHRVTAENVLNHFDAWIPEFNDPCLIHGDIWESHLIISENAHKPTINAFVDVQARYSDYEEEIAHLLAFGTAGDIFLKCYTREKPLREGFERRRLIYELHIWLELMLKQGTVYLRAAQRTLDAIERYV